MSEPASPHSPEPVIIEVSEPAFMFQARKAIVELVAKGDADLIARLRALGWKPPAPGQEVKP